MLYRTEVFGHCAPGSLWQPNITVAQLSTADGRSVLAVGFRPDTRCDKYIVIVRCSSSHHITHANKVRPQYISAGLMTHTGNSKILLTITSR